MNRCQTKNEPKVPDNFIDVARILADAVSRYATPSTPSRPYERKADMPTGYSGNSMV